MRAMPAKIGQHGVAIELPILGVKADALPSRSIITWRRSGLIYMQSQSTSSCEFLGRGCCTDLDL
eukprot:15436708-Alexandrium_andersonii.AAC.1